MDLNIDDLITRLRDPEVDVRRDALEKLCNCDDKLHVIPAIHWTMLNDLDEDIRSYAREIYLRIGEQEKSAGIPSEETAETKSNNTGEPAVTEHRVHIKPVIDLEPNIYGTWSIHFSVIAIFVVLAAYFLEIQYVGGTSPPFIKIMKYVGASLTIPGLLLGLIGLFVKDLKRSTPITGLILNAVIFIISAINIALYGL